MAEPKQTTDDTNCDISNGTKVIDHGGVALESIAGCPAQISAKEKSLESRKAVNINQKNGNETTAEGRGHLSKLTDVNFPASVMSPQVRPNLDHTDAKVAVNSSNANDPSNSPESPPKKQDDVSESIDSTNTKEQAGEDTNKNVAQLKASDQTSANSVGKSNGIAHKLISTSTSKTPPPVPRRKSEKVKCGVNFYVHIQLFAFLRIVCNLTSNV